jgi:hypothetical protein
MKVELRRTDGEQVYLLPREKMLLLSALENYISEYEYDGLGLQEEKVLLEKLSAEWGIACQDFRKE